MIELPIDILNHEIISRLDDKSIIKMGMLNKNVRKIIRKEFLRSKGVRATLNGTFLRDLKLLNKLRSYGRVSLHSPYFEYRYETFHVFLFCCCTTPDHYLLIHYCPFDLIWRMYVGPIEILTRHFEILLDENISIVERNRDCRELMKGNIKVIWKLNTTDLDVSRKIKRGYGKWFGMVKVYHC